MSATRVLLVDDSATLRTTLQAVLERAGVRVVGTAADGEEAVRACALLRPEVVLMDVRMPRLDGLQATQRIMRSTPVPILLMTAPDNLAVDVHLGLRALECGALDLIAKPELAALQGGGAERLVARLRLLAGVPVITHPRGLVAREVPPELASDSGAHKLRPTTFHKRARRVVGVVASTGGPRALLELFHALPSDLAAAVVVVQHIDAAFQEGLVRWLDEETPLRTVLAAQPEEELYTGKAYVAPQGRFAEVTSRRKLILRADASARGHCPSGDRLFASLAASYGPQAIGVVLTGMGSDGADGLLCLRRAGGRTIVQDEASSVIWGMPRAALELDAAERVLPLSRVGPAIVELLGA